MELFTLNIFEPRYLNMTEDAISNNRLIGMIQPKSNSKDKIDLYSIGCVREKLSTFRN